MKLKVDLSDLRREVLNVIKRMPELAERSIFDDESTIGEDLLKASEKGGAHSFEWCGRVSTSCGRIYETVGLRERAVDIYRVANGIFMQGLWYPEENSRGMLGDSLDKINYAIQFGLGFPRVGLEEGKKLLEALESKELSDIRCTADYLYQTLTLIAILENPEFTSLRKRTMVEGNCLIAIGDFGMYDAYGISPEVRKQAYDLVRCLDYKNLDHVKEKARLERIALETIVNSVRGVQQ